MTADAFGPDYTPGPWAAEADRSLRHVALRATVNDLGTAAAGRQAQRQARLDAEVANELAALAAIWRAENGITVTGPDHDPELARGIGTAWLLLGAIIILAALAATTPW